MDFQNEQFHIVIDGEPESVKMSKGPNGTFDIEIRYRKPKKPEKGQRLAGKLFDKVLRTGKYDRSGQPAQPEKPRKKAPKATA